MLRDMPAGSRRSFALLWVSQALSQLGTSISTLAYPLLLLGITGSAFVAGLAGTVVAVVGLSVRIPGGIAADRYRYTSLMLVCDAARAIVVASVGAGIRAQAVLTLVVRVAAPLAPVAIGAVIDAWNPTAGIAAIAAVFAALALLSFTIPTFRRGGDQRSGDQHGR